MVTDTTSKIPSWACGFLNAAALSQIESAVKQAELKTSGEIVPMIVRSSIKLRVPRRVLFLFLAFSMTIAQYYCGYDWKSNTHIALELIGCAILFGLVFFAPIPAFILRLLMPLADQKMLVEQRAECEFYRSKIQNTEAQTGILLFVSLAERRAVVLADETISSKLPPGIWDEVLSQMLGGIRRKQAGEGISQAIATCGSILADHFPRSENDRDELANELVLKE